MVWCRKLAWQCCPLLWRSVSPSALLPVVLPVGYAVGALMAEEDPQHIRDGRGRGEESVVAESCVHTSGETVLVLGQFS